MTTKHTRRSFVLGAGGGLGFWALGGLADRARASGEAVGAPLSPWRPGQLDIHVLSTGRGDATLVVAPNGKMLLIDAGAASGDPSAMLARPDEGRSVGAYIADYVRRRLRETGGAGVDVVYVTHLHDDHLGAVADIAASLPIGKLIDPDFPDYGYPPFEGRDAVERYIACARGLATRGMAVERLEVGRCDQFGLNPLSVRALACRGRVWTGEGAGVRDLFPARADLDPRDWPNENASGSAVRLQYGRFSAFFGGDLTDWADGGARPWLDVLSAAARASGRVDVALAPHHGLYDASGPAFVRALQPRHWIVSAWHRTHPSPSTLARLLEPRLNPRLEAVYLTGVSDVAAAMSARLMPRLASTLGHVVVRVDAGGARYRVVVTDQTNDDDIVRVVSSEFVAYAD